MTRKTRLNPNATQNDVVPTLARSPASVRSAIGAVPTGFGTASASIPSSAGFAHTPADIPSGSGDVSGHLRQTVYSGNWAVSVSVTINGTGGTARWTVNGVFADIAPTATASTVQTALQGLSTVGAGGLTVTGGPGGSGGGTPYVVTYAPKYIAANAFLPLTVTTANLTGGAQTATLVWTNNWGGDTGYVWGENGFHVTGQTAGDGNGIAVLCGALYEVDQQSSGTIGTMIGVQAESAYETVHASGPVDTMISLYASGPHYKGGTTPSNCAATNVYGLKVQGAQNSRSFSDGVTSNGSPTVTSATAQFSVTDIGKVVSGSGIPSGAYITAASSTTITLSANATASASSVTVTINGTLNATTAYSAYFGAGVVAINGQTTITNWRDEVGLKVIGLSGQASNLQEWYFPSGNRVCRVSTAGTVSSVNSLVAFEGNSTGTVSIGLTTVSGSHPGISFGSAADAALVRTAPGVISVAAGLQLGVGYTTVAGSRLWSGSGAPSISASVAGDFYFRTDTPSTANQRIYVATATNTWTGIL